MRTRRRSLAQGRHPPPVTNTYWSSRVSAGRAGADAGNLIIPGEADVLGFPLRRVAVTVGRARHANRQIRAPVKRRTKNEGFIPR